MHMQIYYLHYYCYIFYITPRENFILFYMVNVSLEIRSGATPPGAVAKTMRGPDHSGLANLLFTEKTCEHG